MRSFFAIATLAAFIPAVFGAPTAELKPIQRYAGAKKENSYIVTLKKGASRTAFVSKLRSSKSATMYDKDFLNGFAADLTEAELNEIRANDDVELIEENGIMTVSATQTNAPWGLQRISQAGRVSGSVSSLTFTHRYDSTGSGVDIYIIDTGINTSHNDFGGRARWGSTFGGYPNADGHGHGTHCAGTAGGNQFGLAKGANLIAVKVLSDAGSGTVADIVNGMNYVLTQMRATGRPSVASMSLGGSGSTTLDNAVATLTSGGVHVVVAAGNSAANVSGFSPARAPSAITVGASDINDALASFSNYGAGVDVIAPGVSVISAYRGSTTATSSLSGTSMACPHVAGLAAVLISKNGNMTPAALSSLITSTAVTNAISGLPSGTPNRFANNGFR